MQFKASVQYNDWTGTAAADDADKKTIRDLFLSDGSISADEFIIGVRAWVGENHGGEAKDAQVYVLVVPASEYKARLSKNPVRVKEVEKSLPVGKLIGLFKRFEIAITMRGDLEPGREYEPE